MAATVNGRQRTTLGASEAMNQTVAIYARVSTEDQSEKETIKNQLDFLRRYVDLHELPVAGEYTDDGVSGGIPLALRPEGRRLLEDAEAGRFGSVIVYRLTRLGRTLKVICEAHDALAASGVAIRSGTEPFDTSTPTGTLVFQMLASFAEYDRSMIAETMGRGRNRAASKGRYTGGPIPFGYDVDETGQLVPSERFIPQLGLTEAEYVASYVRRIADGETTANAEGARLTALGVPRERRYGGEARVSTSPSWSLTTMRRLVHNPIYKGENVIASRWGSTARPLPALVDAATWERAQAALLRNRNLSPKNAKRTYLLRGLVRCAGCGRSYCGGAHRHRTVPGGERVYRCSTQTGNAAGRAAGDVCTAKVIPAAWLEDAVWQECAAFIRDPGPALDDARRKLRERMAESTHFDAERRATLDALAEKEIERERILTMYRRGKIDDAEAEAQLDAIAKEAGQLRERVESMRAQAALIDASEMFLTESAALLAQFRDELDAIEAANDQARKRAFLERYVRRITVESRRVGPRTLEADVRLFLRFQPEPIAVEGRTPRRSATSTRGRFRS